MFAPKHIKEGKMLLKGVEKFIHYKRDVLSPAKLDEIKAAMNSFTAALKSRDKGIIQKESKEIQTLCHKAVPQLPQPMIRENVEVFFVAIVIALGIRAYFLQPFKIPTGSMQPTLNGYIGYPLAAQEAANPNIIKQGWDLAWKGRSYIDEVADRDFKVTAVYQYDLLRFFPLTIIEREGMNREKLSDLRIWSPLDQVLKSHDGLGLASALRISEKPAETRPTPRAGIPDERPVVTKGTVLARGYVETGDQVLVNKFSYHFRKPRRGEVFVFTTKGIPLIERQYPGQPSQHYIKRLAALPGDQWEMKPPEVLINGVRPTHPKMIEIMDKKGIYSDRYGYTRAANYDEHFRRDIAVNAGRLGQKEYLALGDNSAQSSDSRFWGPVPEKNLVGPALFTYLPFGNHFGLIR